MTIHKTRITQHIQNSDGSDSQLISKTEKQFRTVYHFRRNMKSIVKKLGPSGRVSYFDGFYSFTTYENVSNSGNTLVTHYSTSESSAF